MFKSHDKYDQSHNARKLQSDMYALLRFRYSFGICAVKSEYSLDAFWLAKDAKFLHVDNKDSDQTAQAYLSLHWVHVSEDTFSRLAARKDKASKLR